MPGIRTASAPFTRHEYQGAMYWILEVFWSRTLRWATDPLNLEDRDGAAFHLAGGLDPSFNVRVEWFGEVPGELEASFMGLRPPPGLNMGRLALEGHALTGAVAELSQWVPGRAWEDRRVVLRGRLRTPSVGGADEPMSFTVRAERRTDLAKLPAPAEQINLTTWPGTAFFWDDAEQEVFTDTTLPASSVGLYYPIVYGLPGFRDARASRFNVPNKPVMIEAFNRGGGSPAALVLVDYNIDGNGDPQVPGATAIAVVMGTAPIYVNGVYEPLVEGNTVTVLNISKGEFLEGVPLRTDSPTGVDGLGRQVAFVEIIDRYLKDDPWVVGDELWIVWPPRIGSTPSDRRVGGLRNAGDVIEHALRTGGAEVDLAGWEAIRQELGSFLVDTYRDKPQDAWDFVSSELLPLLPVGVVDGAQGLRPVLWRWDAGPADAQGHLVAGRLGLERAGQPRAWEDWANAVRVNYRPKTSGTDFESTVSVVGTPLVDTGGVASNALRPDVQHPTVQTLSSAALHGLREARVVDAVSVMDAGTAQRIAAWTAAAFAFPGVLVDMRDLSRSWAHVEAGAPLLYSDEELGWDRRLVWLVGRKWDGTSPTITLLYLHDPARGAR